MAADGAGELDERLEPGSRRPGQPGVEVRGRERRVVEVVEQPELLLEQERAVERLVGLLDLARACASWSIVCFAGALSSDQRVPLIHLPVGGVGALVGVPLVAADLVDRALREAHDVERVKAISASGTASRIACWYPPDMSIETARIELAARRRARRRTPAGWRCCGPGRTTRSRPWRGRRPRSGSAARGDRRSRRRRSRPARRAGARRGDRRRPAPRSARPCPSRSAAGRRSASRAADEDRRQQHAIDSIRGRETTARAMNCGRSRPVTGSTQTRRCPST